MGYAVSDRAFVQLGRHCTVQKLGPAKMPARPRLASDDTCESRSPSGLLSSLHAPVPTEAANFASKSQFSCAQLRTSPGYRDCCRVTFQLLSLWSSGLACAGCCCFFW